CLSRTNGNENDDCSEETDCVCSNRIFLLHRILCHILPCLLLYRIPYRLLHIDRHRILFLLLHGHRSHRIHHHVLQQHKAGIPGSCQEWVNEPSSSLSSRCESSVHRARFHSVCLWRQWHRRVAQSR
ncbi:hypothetical protein PENTCL1PPCAC_11968, partial [Pristionchus entomophagus]